MRHDRTVQTSERWTGSWSRVQQDYSACLECTSHSSPRPLPIPRDSHADGRRALCSSSFRQRIPIPLIGIGGSHHTSHSRGSGYSSSLDRILSASRLFSPLPLNPLFRRTQHAIFERKKPTKKQEAARFISKSSTKREGLTSYLL